MNTEIYDGVIQKPDIDELFDDTCLAHFGVKGMRWGVRHDKKSSGKSHKSIKERYLQKNKERMDARKAQGKDPTKRQYIIANKDKQYDKDYKRYRKHGYGIFRSAYYANRYNRFNTGVSYYKNVKKYGIGKAYAAEMGHALLRGIASTVGKLAIGTFTSVGMFMLFKGNMSWKDSKAYAKGNRRAVANFAMNKAVDLMKKVRKSQLARKNMKEFSKNVIKIAAKPVVDANWRYV